MLIQDTCTKSVVCADMNTSLQEATEIMKNQHVGSLVIVESMQDKKPLGFLTDRDIVIKIAEHMPLSTRVREVMSTDLLTINNQEGVSRAIEEMRYRGVRRIVITDSKGQTCGILSTDDIIQSAAREINEVADLLTGQTEQEGLRQHTRMC